MLYRALVAEHILAMSDARTLGKGLLEYACENLLMKFNYRKVEVQIITENTF